MEVNIFTPSIAIVLNELYTEFFKQVFKIKLLNTKQGHKDKDFGCVSVSVVYHLKLCFLIKKKLQGIAIP